ncbi:hypothetical protein WDU94_001221 [Cyamophila willieti]
MINSISLGVLLTVLAYAQGKKNVAQNIPIPSHFDSFKMEYEGNATTVSISELGILQKEIILVSTFDFLDNSKPDLFKITRDKTHITFDVLFSGTKVLTITSNNIITNITSDIYGSMSFKNGQPLIFNNNNKGVVITINPVLEYLETSDTKVLVRFGIAADMYKYLDDKAKLFSPLKSQDEMWINQEITITHQKDGFVREIHGTTDIRESPESYKQETTPDHYMSVISALLV